MVVYGGQFHALSHIRKLQHYSVWRALCRLFTIASTLPASSSLTGSISLPVEVPGLEPKIISFTYLTNRWSGKQLKSLFANPATHSRKHLHFHPRHAHFSHVAVG